MNNTKITVIVEKISYTITFFVMWGILAFALYRSNFLAYYYINTSPTLNLNNYINAGGHDYDIVLFCYAFICISYILCRYLFEITKSLLNKWNCLEYLSFSKLKEKDIEIDKIKVKKGNFPSTSHLVKWEDQNLSEENWKVIKEKLLTLSNNFLTKHYQMIFDGQFSIIDDGFSNACYSSAFDPITGEVILSLISLDRKLLTYCFLVDNFEYLQPTIHHELVHYALFKQGENYADGTKRFESEIERLNIPSSFATAKKGQIAREERYTQYLVLEEAIKGDKNNIYLKLIQRKIS